MNKNLSKSTFDNLLAIVITLFISGQLTLYNKLFLSDFIRLNLGFENIFSINIDLFVSYLSLFQISISSIIFLILNIWSYKLKNKENKDKEI
jgi:hypothetical protein